MELLFLIALGWFLIEFEPLHMALAYLQTKLPEWTVLEYVFNAFTCCQCMTFWSALVYTASFELAVTASFLTFIIELINQLWSRSR